MFRKCQNPDVRISNVYCTIVESETIWAKGNVARSNWLCDVTHLGCGCMTSYISTTQHYIPTLQPTTIPALQLNLQRSTMVLIGIGQEKQAPDRVRPLVGNDERIIGQKKKTNQMVPLLDIWLRSQNHCFNNSSFFQLIHLQMRTSYQKNPIPGFNLQTASHRKIE